MLVEACRERKIPDCEFFINKRDYPQLKVNVPRGVPVEPYGFIFDKDDRDPDQDVDLCEEHKFATYAPIFSFYAAKKDRFADIPFPSSGAKLLLTSFFADNTIPFIPNLSLRSARFLLRSLQRTGREHAERCSAPPSSTQK